MAFGGDLFGAIAAYANRPPEKPNLETGKVLDPSQTSFATVGAYNTDAQYAAVQQKLNDVSGKLRALQSQLDRYDGLIRDGYGAKNPNIAAERARVAEQMKVLQDEQGRLTQMQAQVQQQAAGQREAVGAQNRQIDPAVYKALRDAANGVGPSGADLAQRAGALDISQQTGRAQANAFNQSQSAVRSARSYNAGLARSAIMANAGAQADISGRSSDALANLAARSAAERANEMAAARGQYAQYALGQQGLNDSLANAIRNRNLSMSGMYQAGQAGYASAKSDMEKANMANDMWRRQAEYSALLNRNQANKEAAEKAGNATDVVGSIVGNVLSDGQSKYNVQSAGGLSGLSGDSTGHEWWRGMLARMANGSEAQVQQRNGSGASLLAGLLGGSGGMTANSTGNSASAAKSGKSGGGAGLLGSLIGLLSDENSKKGVNKVGGEGLSDQFAKVSPVSFDYKPEFGGEHRYGVVAQDLERTPVGKTLVKTVPTPEGPMKAIDQNAATSALLGVAADQAQRIKALEDFLGKIGDSTRKKPAHLKERGPNLKGKGLLNALEVDYYNHKGKMPSKNDEFALVSKARRMGGQ